MKLKELLHGLDVLELHADEALDITGVQYDSRQVTPGALFVAISGFQTDGHKYISKAMENGAVCVVCEKKPETDIPYVLVSNARSALAALGANWFGHPADAMCVVGITGTNGKTTSTYLLKHVLEKTLGAKVGLIGTIQNMIGDEILHTERTTPESFELQKLFADMRDAGCTHVIMEVSSHALVLHRADQIRFGAAVFTNLTEDHLDFHQTMDAYCDAKAMIFRRCETGAVNVDDAYAKRIMEQADCRLLTYSAQGTPAALTAEHIGLFSDRVEFDAVYQDERAAVTLGIPGIFSVYNALSVIAAALALHTPLAEIADALRTAQSVKGRVEVVPTPGKDYTVLIDYSHTPDSLEGLCAASARAASSPSSAAAATATLSSAPSWAKSRQSCLTSPSSPQTIPAPKIPIRSSGRSLPGCRIPKRPTRSLRAAFRPLAGRWSWRRRTM